MKYQILQGDNRDTLKTIADNSIDAIVTDPPYGIDFLGKEWDANTGALETYKECLRVLKPGGYIVAFSAARTYHHLAITLEQAGFEIKDQIMWLYSSGFPKSQDIGRQIQRNIGVEQTKPQSGFNAFASKNGTAFIEDWNRDEKKKDKIIVTDPIAKQWEGWGTSLKPAHEPIALARKPTPLTYAENSKKYGLGGLNINATRVGDEIFDTSLNRRNTQDTQVYDGGWAGQEGGEIVQGRFTANVIGEVLQGDYQKYFYCPKINCKERHIGFDTTNIPTDPSGYQGSSNGGNYIEKKQGVVSTKSMLEDMGGYYIDSNGNALNYEDRGNDPQIYLPHCGVIYTHGLKEEYRKWCKANNKTPNTGNNHPTVKPVELMKYLIKLITPPGGIVLDPFNGSGSTGMAAVELGHEYIGCELDPAYVEIATKRIEAYWELVKPNNNFDKLFGEE